MRGLFPVYRRGAWKEYLTTEVKEGFTKSTENFGSQYPDFSLRGSAPLRERTYLSDLFPAVGFNAKAAKVSAKIAEVSGPLRVHCENLCGLCGQNFPACDRTPEWDIGRHFLLSTSEAQCRLRSSQRGVKTS